MERNIIKINSARAQFIQVCEWIFLYKRKVKTEILDFLNFFGFDLLVWGLHKQYTNIFPQIVYSFLSYN